MWATLAKQADLPAPYRRTHHPPFPPFSPLFVPPRLSFSVTRTFFAGKKRRKRAICQIDAKGLSWKKEKSRWKSCSSFSFLECEREKINFGESWSKSLTNRDLMRYSRERKTEGKGLNDKVWLNESSSSTRWWWVTHDRTLVTKLRLYPEEGENEMEAYCQKKLLHDDVWLSLSLWWMSSKKVVHYSQ